MGDKSAGLLPKYHVERTDGKPVEFYFVLEPDRDPMAVEALEFYAILAKENGYKALAKDLQRVTSSFRNRVCDCGWIGVTEQLKTKGRRGLRCLCPECGEEVAENPKAARWAKDKA